jgi:hypothetical protein
MGHEMSTYIQVVTYRAPDEERRKKVNWPIRTMNREYEENGHTIQEENEKAKQEK